MTKSLSFLSALLAQSSQRRQPCTPKHSRLAPRAAADPLPPSLARSLARQAASCRKVGSARQPRSALACIRLPESQGLTDSSVLCNRPQRDMAVPRTRSRSVLLLPALLDEDPTADIRRADHIMTRLSEGMSYKKYMDVRHALPLYGPRPTRTNPSPSPPPPALHRLVQLLHVQPHELGRSQRDHRRRSFKHQESVLTPSPSPSLAEP